MFTGIIEEVGRVKSHESSRLTVEASLVLGDTRVGDSIAVNGACLTVVSMNAGSFSVDVTPETLRRTNLGPLRPGDGVNLERPLAVGDRLGGHIVQGHVDGTGEVLSIMPEGDSLLMRFQAPRALMRYIVEKGYIAVDGASLTIVDCDERSFSISLIPYTRDHTTLGSRSVGDVVNLETDILARQVERLMAARLTPERADQT